METTAAAGAPVALNALWLIPALPLAGAAVNGLRALFVRWTPGSADHAHDHGASAGHGDQAHEHDHDHGPAGAWPAGWIATAFMLAAFGVAMWAFVTQLLPLHGAGLTTDPMPWIVAGNVEIHARLLLDPLSGLLALVVTGVGTLIHLYSVGYMAHDENRDRYFAYLNLFAAMMLILILGDSLPLLFVGWEGVGLCSYLLIGFWYTDEQKAIAGKKAFVVNRVGDLGFLLGMFLLFAAAPTQPSLTFSSLADVAHGHFSPILLTTACLLLFVGACGKSAQFPLYIWLPDAMAGPTPVSALIHAATMVTAGVYMIARLHFLFELAPIACAVIASVGAFTALFAATMGFVQNDVKKVLAYSTVSQLGFMVMAVGAAGTGYIAGVYHLTTHAFFKALLFLGSGSLIHAMHHALPADADPNDIRSMGGMRHKMPWTFRTFIVGWAAIAGFPFFSGFFSKDEVLASTLHSERLASTFTYLPQILFAAGVLAAACTAFYMTRLLILVFFGKPRMGAAAEPKVHESGWQMVVPMVVLAVLSALGGILWAPLFGWAPLEHFLAPVIMGQSGAFLAGVHSAPHFDWTPTILATAAFVAGTWLAHYLYIAHPEMPTRLAARRRGLYRMLWNKWFVDEAIEGIFVNPVRKISESVLWKGIDVGVIDGTVNGVGALAAKAGAAVGRLQTGLTQNYAVGITGGVAVLAVYVLARLYS